MTLLSLARAKTHPPPLQRRRSTPEVHRPLQHWFPRSSQPLATYRPRLPPMSPLCPQASARPLHSLQPRLPQLQRHNLHATSYDQSVEITSFSPTSFLLLSPSPLLSRRLRFFSNSKAFAHCHRSHSVSPYWHGHPRTFRCLRCWRRQLPPR